MPLALNPTDDVVALHVGDGVRVRAARESGYLTSLDIDLSARDGETHCLVAMPSLPSITDTANADLLVWLNARYEGEGEAPRPFTLFIAGYRNGKSVGEQPARFFAGPDDARLALRATVPTRADRYQLVVYADRHYRGRLVIRDIRLTVGTTEYRVGSGEHHTSQVSLARRWEQAGTRVRCSSIYGEHWADMPQDWRLDGVNPSVLRAADWLLFSGLDRLAFGVSQPVPVGVAPHSGRAVGSRTLLHYTATTDSTAAMTLLPEPGVRFHCQRAFQRYSLSSGAGKELPDPAPWTDRVRRVANTTVVPNTFELAQIAAGGPLGFSHRYGALAFGLLLAEHVGAGVLAVGSVLDHVFLGSGHQFVDVVALDRSSYNTVRRLVEGAGLGLALPTAGCSEVLTTRISDTGRYAGLAISCPRAGADGAPCGTCFACFRRLRFAGQAAPAPDESALGLLERRPLKSAASVIYAAQRSGFRHPATDDYHDVELGFLERHFEYALEHMVPMDVAAHIRGELRALGIHPMSEEDELHLRTIGQTFSPESFSWSRAGFGEAASPS